MNQYANDFTRTTQIYYEDLRKFKPLSKTRERRLLRKCRKGDLDAKNELIEANLKFVFNVAKRYKGRGVPMSELISDGNMGLLKAIEKFDYKRNVRFISYAVWWIRQSILESIKRNSLISFIDIEADSGNDDVLDKKLFDDDSNDGNSKGQSSIDDEGDRMEMKEHRKEVISSLMTVLDERERDIVEHYYGLNDKDELTLYEIGDKFNLSAERVRQIKERSMKKLRTKMMLFEDISTLF